MSKKIVKPNIDEALKKTPPEFKPYDQTHSISRLKFFVTIIKHHYDKDVLKILNKHEVGISFITHGRGTGTKGIYDILGLSDTRKDIIFSIVKADQIASLKQEIATFYAREKDAKGIAFAIDISSVIGLSIYKYLSNTRTIGE